MEQGTEAGTVQVFSEASWQASSHFGIGRDGSLDQFVDTANRAWAEAAGNAFYISIEHEGLTGQDLTPAQLDTHIRLTAWLRSLYVNPYPLVLAEAPGQPGLGWHGMGGVAWGGHYLCPGDPIKARRADVITALLPSTVPPTPPQEEPMNPSYGLFMPNQIDRFAVDQSGNLVHHWYFRGGPNGPDPAGWYHETVLTGLVPLSQVDGPLRWPAPNGDGFVHIYATTTSGSQAEAVYNGRGWVTFNEAG